MTAKNGHLVMIGVDGDGKAHAARFDSSNAAAVRKAAALMGFRMGTAKNEQAAQVVRSLAAGKLFESGKGMVPLVREELFYNLGGLLDYDDLWTTFGVVSGTVSKPENAVTKAADEYWSSIKPGSTILVHDRTYPGEPCWCAAVVTAVARDGKRLTARWRDYPGFKPFEVDRRAVALIRPDIGC